MAYLKQKLTLASGLTWLLLWSGGSIAGNLYSWAGADGTPTYSPDPPAPGTVYTIVGPDLKPISRYKKSSSAAAASPISDSDTASAEAIAKPQPKAPKWKPVVFANAPSGQNASQPASTPASTPASKPPSASTAQSNVSSETTACLKLRQNMVGLENQFARAASYAEMDQAILALQDKTSEYRAKCK